MNGSVATALLLATLAGLSTGIGSLLGIAFKPGARFMSASLGFAAGIMILVSFVELLPDAFATIGFGPAYLAFFGGMAFMLFVDFLIPHIYLAEDHSGGDPARNLRRTALLVGLGIGIHNFPEGMATFAGALRSTHLGMAMAAAIAAHNIPEGLAVAAPIYAATGKRGRAFLLSFLSGIAEPVGAGLAALVLAPILTRDAPRLDPRRDRRGHDLHLARRARSRLARLRTRPPLDRGRDGRDGGDGGESRVAPPGAVIAWRPARVSGDLLVGALVRAAAALPGERGRARGPRPGRLPPAACARARRRSCGRICAGWVSAAPTARRRVTPRTVWCARPSAPSGSSRSSSSADCALPPEEIARGWRIEGREHLERARRRAARLHPRRRAHGQLGAARRDSATRSGRRVVAPVEEQFHPLLSAAVKRAKERWRIDSPPARTGLRGLVRALARGDLVALPVDGGAYRHGVEVPLLAARVRLARGAAQLSVLSGCPIVCVFSIRTRFMTQTVRVLEPLGPEAGAPSLAAELAARLGEHLRATPGQWCVFRPLA